MKIKITKCTNPIHWYNYEIGKIYEVIDQEFGFDHHTVRIDEGLKGIVDFDDAEILNEETLRE